MKKKLAAVMAFFCIFTCNIFGADYPDGDERTLLPIARMWNELDDAQSCLRPVCNVSKNGCYYSSAAALAFFCLPDSLVLTTLYGFGILSGCLLRDIKLECIDNPRKAYRDQQVLEAFIFNHYTSAQMSNIDRFGKLNLAERVALRNLSARAQAFEAPRASKMK